jgi:hypothetical protein
MERFCAGENRGNFKKPTQEDLYPISAIRPKSYNFQYLVDLPEEHKAVQYVIDRKIPKEKWDDIGYTDDMGKLAEEFDESYKDRFSKEDRLVVVIRNSSGICGFQCRTFSKKTKRGMKYFTLKKEKELCYYGLDKVDLTKKFYILEGPINSMFIQNAIATLGSSNFTQVHEKIDDTNAVYVLDNEPYKKETVQLLEKLINMKKTVCIFPENITEKDINDMVSAGLDAKKLIDQNTYSDLKAKLVLTKWKKTMI